MTVNSELARIFGSDNDSISLGPVGTALPVTIDGALNGALEDVGWIHSDGITETFTGSKSEIRGHQGARVVRTRVETPGTTISFHALESKAQTKSLRYDEKDVSVTDGVRKVTRGAGQKVSPRSAVIDVFDADDVTVKERWVIPRLEISPDGDRVFANSDIAGFPFIGEIIGDYYVYESSPSPLSATWTVEITGTPTAGTYTLTVNGVTTAPLAYNAATAVVAAAINALSGVTGIAGVTASGTATAVALTFPSVVTVEASGSLTGATVAVSITA